MRFRNRHVRVEVIGGLLLYIVVDTIGFVSKDDLIVVINVLIIMTNFLLCYVLS